MLRISSIRIRNLAATPWRGRRQRAALLEWAELVHTLPVLLMGEVHAKAVRYFLEAGGASFKKRYPDAADSDFRIVCGLLDELSVLVRPSGPP